jgi:hypothetical protein
MCVNESGQQRRVTEVDDACTRRMLDGRADSSNALPCNEDLTGLKQLACVHLQQSRCVQHNRGRFLRLSPNETGGQCQCEDQASTKSE